MSLKHIKENYARLLTAFKEAGVKLTESQKKDIDGFILALNENMEKQKKLTINATRKVVESEMEKEYRKTFESIMEHLQENARLAGKIQTKVAKINESKKLANEVDGYLTKVLNEALPAKKIVDYDKMQRMETIIESLKDTLIVNDETIAQKREQLAESFNKDKELLDAKITNLEKQLNESKAKSDALKKELDKKEAKECLANKTKDLPLFEARTIRNRLANATKEEIEKNFKKLLESVREEMNEEDKEEEKTLEEEISEIIKKESSDKTDSTEEPAPKADDSTDDEEPTDESEEKDEDQPEEVSEEEEDDGIELDESEQIPSYLMQQWINRSKLINPIG